MESGLITSWQIDGETVTDFIFLGSKITADGDCSHAIKRCLLLGRKVMTNLDSIFKSRDITLSTKVHCSDHFSGLSYLSLLFCRDLHSNGYIFPFILCLSLLFFPQLFIRPPQTTILIILNHIIH